jgi:hypothetical protein
MIGLSMPERENQAGRRNNARARDTPASRETFWQGKFYRVHGHSQCCDAKNLCAGMQCMDVEHARHRIGNTAGNAQSSERCLRFVPCSN